MTHGTYNLAVLMIQNMWCSLGLAMLCDLLTIFFTVARHVICF